MIQQYRTNQKRELEPCNETGKNRWIDLLNPSLEEIEEISAQTKIDKDLFIKVLDDDEVSRIEQGDEGIMIIVSVPYIQDQTAKNRYQTTPLGILIGQDSIVTISTKNHTILEDFYSNTVKEFDTAKRTRMVIQLLYKIATKYLICLKEINTELIQKEHLLYHMTQNKELINLLNVEKSLVYFITSLKSNDIVLEKLKLGSLLTLYEEDVELLNDAMIENKQGMEMANIYREILTSMSNTYATIISNNLNIIMKFLAGITIVLSIPTIIASFLGMNVPLGILSNNPWAFLGIGIFATFISILVAIILKKKNMM